jgi:hypothetical protein
MFLEKRARGKDLGDEKVYSNQIANELYRRAASAGAAPVIHCIDIYIGLHRDLTDLQYRSDTEPVIIYLFKDTGYHRLSIGRDTGQLRNI